MSIELREIGFKYPSMAADLFSGLSLTVADGESVALVGPSGRGKTTLLAIAGLMLAPDRGSVLIDGRPVGLRDAPSLLGRDVAWVLQTVNLLPRRTVLDNTALPLLASGWRYRAASARAAEVLADVGVDLDWNREGRSVSGGEAQRVGLARALTTRPKLLLVDEPTANLDWRTTAAVSEWMFKAAREKALLVATHDWNVARMADRIVQLGPEDAPEGEGRAAP
ncbi:MAG: ATP-binding cassette domain-containing protein [Bifidobacteriaceae bacterium]|jgi:ABC-type lipoprotein export system ATPase subunit|nr:ATP-binding cassette domain-containing protein [Bifidobacteriaceae bacterium]